MTQRPVRAALLALTLAFLGVGGFVAAQNADDGGSFEVGGIDVDVVGKSPQAARLGGWRIAQRKGWELLAKRYGRSGGLSDSALDAVVSGIVVEDEKIGGNRYIARLGVEFSRARAAAMLGIAGAESRSAPMLVIPVMWSGGAGTAFEQRTPWQEAWARFRTGNSTIDYVRPSGTGPDALIMNTGQVLRPGRTWWRSVLAQYGATNVLIPIVHLRRQWPGGPVIGDFQARYGPDNHLLGHFSLRVATADGIPALLDAGIKRINDIYERALGAGLFKGDPGLNFRPQMVAPAEETIDGNSIGDQPPIDDRGTSITVQVETMTSGALTAAESSIRGVPGVRSVVTTSLALGAISVMRVGYDGDPAGLAAGLEARGWQVTRGNGAIRIQRPTNSAPAAPDDKTGG